MCSSAKRVNTFSFFYSNTHSVNMNVLVDAFRKNKINEDVLQKIQVNDSTSFKMHSSYGKRPNPIKKDMNVDVPFLRKVAMHFRKSRQAGKRLGHEWNPSGATIMKKQTEDDSTFSTDDLRGLNDVCTKWCTHTFFPDATSRLNFIANVFKLYTTLSREVPDLKFDIIFKGGVIMRLLILEVVKEFSPHAASIAEKYLKDEKALSFSDFDFEIVTHNHSPRADLIHRLFSLDFAILMWLRSTMDTYSSDRIADNPLIDMSWDEAAGVEQLKEYLQQEVDSLKDTHHPLHKATIDHVVRGCHDKHPPKGYNTSSGKATQTKRDNVVIFSEKGKDEKSVVSAQDFFTELDVPGVPCEYPVDFYCTMNTYIGEGTPREREEQLRSTFHLCRIKQGFVVYLTTKTKKKCCERLGGEMIDLSQSHGIGVDEMRRYLYSKVHEPYRLYYIIGSQFHIRSYSANGLLHDLKIQIHFQDQPPFESINTASKTKKRLLRYAMFLVIYVLGPFVVHPFQKKVRTLCGLVTTTSSLEQLYRYKRTGIQPVDEFVKQEQVTLSLAGPVNKKQRYLSTLHRHLRMISALVASKFQSVDTMDDRYLEFADTFLY